MQFSLVDRIVELEEGVRIRAVKSLTLAEEYLADHFPRFAVMPGVLMLESLVQAGAWLLRASPDFPFPVITLKEAQNVRYSGLVLPGDMLTIEVELIRRKDPEAQFRAAATLRSGRTAVSGRITLRGRRAADRLPTLAELDERLRKRFEADLRQLRVSADVLTPNP